jgi:hypothetical protein
MLKRHGRTDGQEERATFFASSGQRNRSSRIAYAVSARPPARAVASELRRYAMKAPARAAGFAMAMAMMLLAACSGGSNAKKNAAQTSAPASTAASATAVATASPAVTAPPASTLTPRATSAAIPSVRPSAAASPRVTATSQQALDQALQAQLEAASLRESDLPSGFQQSSSNNEPGDLSGVVASHDATFTRVSQGNSGLTIDAIVVALVGFKDAATAQSGFGDVRRQLSTLPDTSITLTPVTLTQRFGDETLAFKVSGEASGVQVNGYAIVWRRSRLAAALVQVGAPGPQTIDQLVSLAQTQDDRLKNVR